MKAAVASAMSVCMLLGSLTIPVSSALSQSVTPSPQGASQGGSSIPASEARGKGPQPATITVSPYGLVLSFFEVRETIERFWATDASNLRIGSDASPGKGARLLFLKSTSPAGTNPTGTSLTVLTRTPAGATQIYNFLIEFTSTRPNYSIVRIYPDTTPVLSTQTPQPPPIAPNPQPSPITQTTPSPRRGSRPQPETASRSVPASPSPQPEQPPVSASRSVIPEQEPAPISLKPGSEPPVPAPPAPVQPQPEQEPAPISIKPQPEQEPPPAPNVRSQGEPTPKPTDTPPVTAAANPPTPPATSRPLPSYVDQANALIRGLVVANRTREVSYNSSLASRVQNLTRRLRRGENLQDAARLELVPFSVVRRLLQLGNYQGSV
jgi:hypothetical protein